MHTSFSLLFCFQNIYLFLFQEKRIRHKGHDAIKGIADAEKLFNWTIFVRHFDENDMKTMEDDMEFLIENGMMRNRVDVRSLFLPSAVK